MFGDIGRMLQLFSQVRTKLPQINARLAESVFTAEEAGGAVRASVNGKLLLVGLEIDGSILDGAGAEAVADLVKSAVASAQQKAMAATAETLKELTGGMDIAGLEGLIG